MHEMHTGERQLLAHLTVDAAQPSKNSPQTQSHHTMQAAWARQAQAWQCLPVHRRQCTRPTTAIQPRSLRIHWRRKATHELPESKLCRAASPPKVLAEFQLLSRICNSAASSETLDDRRHRCHVEVVREVACVGLSGSSPGGAGSIPSWDVFLRPSWVSGCCAIDLNSVCLCCPRRRRSSSCCCSRVAFSAFSASRRSLKAIAAACMPISDLVSFLAARLPLHPASLVRPCSACRACAPRNLTTQGKCEIGGTIGSHSVPPPTPFQPSCRYAREAHGTMQVPPPTFARIGKGVLRNPGSVARDCTTRRHPTQRMAASKL